MSKGVANLCVLPGLMIAEDNGTLLILVIAYPDQPVKITISP